MNWGPGETPYEVLGLPRAVSGEDIRRAYRSLVEQYHPDRFVGNPLQELATERLARINAAYELLSDPRERAAYDAQLSPEATGSAGPDAPGRSVALAWFVRALGIVVALALLAPLLRAVVARSHTPLGMVLVLALVVAGGWWWLRRRRRKRRG